MNADELIAKVRQFDQLDRRCLELMDQSGRRTDRVFPESFAETFELCAKAYSLRNSIKLEMGESNCLHVPDSRVRKIVRQIRGDHDFWVIRVYLTIAEILNKSAGTENDEFPADTRDFILERFDELFSEFHSWFDIRTYYDRKAQVGCVAAARPANRTIDEYHSEIREAYAFACYRACVALCRALMELVLHDALKRRGLLRETTLSCLIDGASKTPAHNPIIEKTEREAAWRVKDQAEKILHFRDRTGRDESGVTEDEAFRLIGDTVKVVEAVISR